MMDSLILGVTKNGNVFTVRKKIVRIKKWRVFK